MATDSLLFHWGWSDADGVDANGQLDISVTLTFDLLSPNSNWHIYEPKYICDQHFIKNPVNGFYRATACNATHCTAVAFLSVCKMRALWQNEIIVCQYLNTTRNKHISSLSCSTGLAGNCSLPPEIFAEIYPPPERNASISTLCVGCARTADQPLQATAWLSCAVIISIFAARAYARAVLGVVILPSVRLSVCLSHAWIVTKLNDALQIFLYHTKGQSLCYFDTNIGWWATPPSLWNLRSKWPTPLEKRWLRPIFAHNVSTVGDSEKSSVTTNI